MREKELLIAKTKFEVYNEVNKKIDEIMNGDLDMLDDYSTEVWRLKNKFEKEIEDLEFEIEDDEL